MTQVIIIGAGPYGLAIAGNLRQRNIPFRIFGRTMAMWTDHMPKGMLLKSDGFATNLGGLPLTLEQFCKETNRPYGDVGHRTPIDDLIAYGHAVQTRYVGTVEDVRVVSVARHANRFLVLLETGERINAQQVIVASGLMGFERLPEITGLRQGQMSHASAHNDLGIFAGRRVVVIGGGQSAFETAALLHEQGAAHVTVLSRRPPFWFDPEGESVPNWWTRMRHPNFGLGPGWRAWLWSEAPRLFYHLPAKLRLEKAYSTFGPAGSGWLKHRVIGVSGIERHVGIARRMDDERLTILPQRGNDYQLQVDHIIAATGYKADIRKLAFLAPVLDDATWISAGIPILNRRYEMIPGLHIAGNLSAVAWGPSMRFIYGTNFVGPYLAKVLGPTRPMAVQVNRPLTKQAV